MTGDPRPTTRLILDVERSATGALVGTVVPTERHAETFHGVMGLVAAIERAVDDGPRPTSGSPAD